MIQDTWFQSPIKFSCCRVTSDHLMCHLSQRTDMAEKKKKILSYLPPCNMWTLTSRVHFFLYAPILNCVPSIWRNLTKAFKFRWSEGEIFLNLQIGWTDTEWESWKCFGYVICFLLREIVQRCTCYKPAGVVWNSVAFCVRHGSSCVSLWQNSRVSTKDI